MSTKKEYTMEELEAQYQLAEEKANALKEQIEQKKKEEKELREAQLALEKDARKKEVDDALEAYTTLLRAYMKDYGVYAYTYPEDLNFFGSKFWNQII